MNTKDNADTFSRHKAEFRAEANAIASAFPADNQCIVRERLYRVIEYAIDRHDWYENQRHRFLALSLGLLAVVATLSPVVASLATRIPVILLFSTALALLWIAITGFRMILIYSDLIGPPYPYRTLADIRSWIFRYNFSSHSSTPWLNDNESIATAQVAEIVTAFKHFKSRWLEFAQDPGLFIAEDFEQVFILQLLQKYRADNLKKMTTILINGVYIFLLLLLFSVLIYVFSFWNDLVTFFGAAGFN